jgi:hypothetical protein
MRFNILILLLSTSYMAGLSKALAQMNDGANIYTTEQQESLDTLSKRLLTQYKIKYDQHLEDFKKDLREWNPHIKRWDAIPPFSNLYIEYPYPAYLSYHYAPELQRSSSDVNFKKSSNRLKVFPAIGLFATNNKETDQQTATTNFSGIQPMIELKTIYSNDLFGTLAIDLLTKKIIKNSLNLPINFDYRIQYIPKRNFTGNIKFSISHSTITHSYIGKHSEADLTYKLKSHFIGLGFIIPKDHSWFEFYFEKAYSGEASSSESTQKASKGFRLNTEWIYPISDKFRIIPGLSYYSLKQTSTQYQLSAFNACLSMAREFEF